MPDIAAPPGWYFVRVWDGPGHVNGLQRLPVVLWRLTTEPATALVVRPGEASPAPLTDDDKLAAVGFCPPDREWQTFFPDEEVRAAMARWKTGGQAPAPGQATVAEVEMPGVGKIPVRDARPPSQQGSTADWIEKAWGGTSRQRLPGGTP